MTLVDRPYLKNGYNYFVYVITHIRSNRRYIGKKNMCWSNRQGSLCETDWRSYWGSSRVLTAHIDKVGKQEFRKEIITFNRGDSLNEACEWAMLFDVAIRDDWKNYYNQESCMKYYIPFLRRVSTEPEYWPHLMKQASRTLGKAQYWENQYNTRGCSILDDLNF